MNRPQPSEHGPSALIFSRFTPESFPAGLARSSRVDYLRCYAADLGAATVVEEPRYFDRDYLSEFVAFYSTSARGYSNACRRLHLFGTEVRELRRTLHGALGGSKTAHDELQGAYLGFVVVRPISATPIGRTVLRWYPETRPTNPRVTEPSRRYFAHLAGLRLHVDGLAWQQQDTAVGACATIALWTMFHTSALDDHHAIPTTAEITRCANVRWPLGRRVFPSDGLTIYQICEAIRAQGLRPAVLEGDIPATHTGSGFRAFNPARFAASCAAFIRSGYPVLLGVKVIENGQLDSVGHAVCAVGFRPGPSPGVPEGEALEDDSGIEYLYLHDDNLGPSVRFALDDLPSDASDPNAPPVALLRADPPPPLARDPSLPDPSARYSHLVPTTLVAALPDEIRMQCDYLHPLALQLAATASRFLDDVGKQANLNLPGVTFSTRFLRLKDYLGAELGRRLSGRKLARARLALVSNVRPMSLHIGVIRVGIGGTPWFDVIHDTTDSEPGTDAFAHVLFQPVPISWIGKLGVCVTAY